MTLPYFFLPWKYGIDKRLTLPLAYIRMLMRSLRTRTTPWNLRKWSILINSRTLSLFPRTDCNFLFPFGEYGTQRQKVGVSGNVSLYPSTVIRHLIPYRRTVQNSLVGLFAKIGLFCSSLVILYRTALQCSTSYTVDPKPQTLVWERRLWRKAIFCFCKNK
jgi:hypothetical protein